MGTDTRPGGDTDGTSAQAAHDGDETEPRTGGDGDGTGRQDGDALLERAREALDRERRRTADERDAFADFLGRVREIRPVTMTASSPATGGAGAGTARALPDGPGTPTGGAAADRLGAVRAAYRETVMSVPHFEAEYDESYAESVAEEFGPEIATVLVGGDRFDERYRRALLEAAEEGRSRRETLVDALDAERESLATHRDRLRSVREAFAAAEVERGQSVQALAEADDGAGVRASFGALAAARSTLVALGDRCDAVAADRQADVHDHARRLSLSVETVDVPTYVYRPLPVTYPVLSAVTDLGSRIDACRRAVDRAIATCA